MSSGDTICNGDQFCAYKFDDLHFKGGFSSADKGGNSMDKDMTGEKSVARTPGMRGRGLHRDPSGNELI
jgi:hypothetical protein